MKYSFQTGKYLEAGCMEEGCKTRFTAHELEVYVPEDIRDKFF
jgi:hypothetical protein